MPATCVICNTTSRSMSFIDNTPYCPDCLAGNRRYEDTISYYDGEREVIDVTTEDILDRFPEY